MNEFRKYAGLDVHNLRNFPGLDKWASLCSPERVTGFSERLDMSAVGWSHSFGPPGTWRRLDVVFLDGSIREPACPSVKLPRQNLIFCTG